MREQIQTWKKWLLAAALGLYMCMLLPGMGEEVLAAEGEIMFSAGSFYSSEGANLLVGVYIDCDEEPQTYHVELVYDTDRLTYVSGAEAELNGVIVLEGTATENRIQYMLDFEPISGGNAGIYVRKALITTADQEEIEIEDLAQARVTISGEDTSGKPDFSFDVADINTQIPILGKAEVEEDSYYLVDLASYIPEQADWPYQTIEDTYGGSQITFLTNAEGKMRYLYLMDKDEQMYLYACGSDGKLYPCMESDDYYYMSALACRDVDGVTEDTVSSENLIYVQYKDGDGALYSQDRSGNYTPWVYEAKDGGTSSLKTVRAGSMGAGFELSGSLKAAIAGILMAILVIAVLMIRRSKARKDQKLAQAAVYMRNLPPEDGYEENRHYIEKEENSEELEGLGFVREWDWINEDLKKSGGE